MRTPLILLFFVFNIAQLGAQSIQVVEKGSNRAVPFALVFNSDTSKSITTDVNGLFDLDVFAAEEFVFVQHLAYETRRVKIKDLNSQGLRIFLNARIKSFDPIVISASLFEESLKNRGERIEFISPRDIQASTAATSADLVQKSGMVSVQKTQSGGGSPIIRSFEANKILLMIDGVRMNNAIYRGGHLQNSITVDPQMLHSVEVLFGPGAVVYGSDAMGGVIHFTSKKPHVKSKGSQSFTANARARLSTALSEESGHIDFTLRGNKLASLTSISYSSYGDLIQGRVRNSALGELGRRTFFVERINSKDSILINPDPEIQRGTAYNQFDFNQKFLLKTRASREHLLNLQVSNSSNIPRYDRLVRLKDSLPQYAEWNYGPQQRIMVSYDYTESDSNNFFDKKRLVASLQKIRESRITRNFNSPIRKTREEKLLIAGLNLNLAHSYKNGVLRIGADAYQNYVNSIALAEDIELRTTSPTDTRYPDGGSQMLFSGAYASVRQMLSANWQFNTGMRISFTKTNASIKDKDQYPFLNGELNNQHFAINGNASIKYLFAEIGSMGFRLSSGFRSPNIDDLSKVFESIPGSVIIPNIDLRPEKIYNAELNLRAPLGKSTLLWTSVYYNLLYDLITRVPGSYQGVDSLIFDGEKSAILQNQNASEAFAYGIATGVQTQNSEGFNFSGSLNYQYGRIKTDSTNYPLDHVPPIYGKVLISYNQQPFYISLYGFFNAVKKLEDYNLFGSDKFDSATPSGLPGWYTLNAQLIYSFNKQLEMELSLENILDANYRTFASAISAPGRNFIFAVRMKI